MGVSGQYGQTMAGLPVPDANGLVVAGADDPGVLVVEGDRADVIQVAWLSNAHYRTHL